MAQAVRTILKSEYNGKLEPLNPWAINYHQHGCENSIWRDDGESLISLEERKSPERKPCAACEYEWELWTKLLDLGSGNEQHPPTWFGDLAYRGLNLDNEVLTWSHPKIEELDPFDVDLVKACHTARKQFEVWLSIERQKNAE